MSGAIDELEKSIDNIMTDEEINEVLTLINRIRHQYEEENPSDTPAFESLPAGASMMAEDALMNGQVTDVNASADRHGTEIKLTIALPHSTGVAQNIQYDPRMD